jgi:hypothetical protein
MIPASANFLSANAALAKQPIYLIEIAGYSRAFTSVQTFVSGQWPWITAIEDLAVTVSDLDGGADLGQFTFAVQDNGRAITADFPGFTFEGKKVTLKSGFPLMKQSDFVLLFTGIVDSVETVNQGGEYQFVCSDRSALLTKVIYATGDSGKPTDNDNPHTINAHPLDILLNILRLEIGIADADIDIAGIENYRDNVYAGLQFSFSLTSAPDAATFIKDELMKPLGAYLRVNAAGQFTVTFFYNPGVGSVMSLGVDQLTEVPDAIQADLINVVDVRFDDDGSQKYFAESIQTDAPSVALYGQYGQIIIQSAGLRSGFQGFSQAGFLARLIFLRYGFKNFKLESVPFFWTACVLEPGDVISFTNPYIPNRKLGTVGIFEQLLEVLDRTWKFSEGIVELTLLDSGLGVGAGALVYKYTVDGDPDYTVATGAHRATHMYLCADTDLYSNADPAHTLI